MKRMMFLTFSLTVLWCLFSLSSTVAQAQAFLPMRIAGPVTAFKPADCAQDGAITIAGVKITIAAGTDVAFIDRAQVFLGNGGLGIANVRSAVWQVIDTGRDIDVYLDPRGRIRIQSRTTIPMTTRALDITGVVSASSGTSITINNLTFAVAAGTTGLPPASATDIVRMRATLNASNEISGAVTVGPPTTKLKICGAPGIYFTAGGIFVPDINPFDPEGPITGFVGPDFVCDQSREVMSWDGMAQMPMAPNFSIRMDISKDVNACYELEMDQFGRITNGSKKIPGTGNSISGTLFADVVQGFTGPFPTSRNEAQQRGAVTISGVTFTIAAGHTVTADAGATPGSNVCLMPVIDPAGETVPFLVGQQAPRRAGQLINGSRLLSGACP